jgi:Ni/Co efflux regulator RcnB
MKRPVTLVLVATLLVSAPAFAAKDFTSKVAKGVEKATRHDDGKRGHDNRDNNHRGNDHRGNDHRGNDNRGNDHRDGGHDRGNDRNDHRNDNDHRYDNRNTNTRHNWNGNHNGNRHDNRGWDRHRSDWSKHPNYWDNRRHDRRDYARYRYNQGHYRAPHGYHYRTWHRGDHLPRAYYGSSYIVYDYRPYRLYAPPYGYHWVRVGNDVLLTALATGVVLDVLYNIWY